MWELGPILSPWPYLRSKSILIPLFEKVLTANDTEAKNGHLVLPKRCVEVSPLIIETCWKSLNLFDCICYVCLCSSCAKSLTCFLEVWHPKSWRDLRGLLTYTVCWEDYACYSANEQIFLGLKLIWFHFTIIDFHQILHSISCLYFTYFKAY